MNKQIIELDTLPSKEVLNSTSEIHFNNVKPGTFLFANSWMSHQLTPNLSPYETKSVHFVVSHREKV
jgi:hypothetical protein